MPETRQAMLLQAPLLATVPGVAHGFETRDGHLATRLPTPAARLRQVHGCEVLVVTDDTDLTPLHADDLDRHPAGDALITMRPATTIAVATADCVPVLLAADDGSAVAAAHAGWRGLAAGVLAATVAQLQRVGVLPEALIAAVGPCVGAATYRVGANVVAAFADAGIGSEVFVREPEQRHRGGPDPSGAADTPASAATWLCDLGAAARDQLLRCGLSPARIERIDRCTFAEPASFHSYRRDGDRAGRMLAGIARL